MENWIFILLLTLCISFLLKSLFNLVFFISANSKSKKKHSPGPYIFPVIGSLLWSTAKLEPTLRVLKAKYGPLITLNIGSRPTIYIGSHSLAYQALVQQGSIFSDRPTAESSNQYIISSASYGPIWRLLRRNLTSEILHPSRFKSYSKARSWLLGILLQQIRHAQVDSVKLIDHFQYAMFCLLVLMCFGDKLEEPQIKQIENMQNNLVLGFRRYKHILKFFPRVGKIIFRNRWKELIELQREQRNIIIPLIEDLKLDAGPKNKRPSTSLCSEFLSAGADTTSTALQWIMANLVKIPSIQEKLYREIASVVGEKQSKLTDEEAVKEEDLQKIPYLKAVILEGLRRNPPGHFVLPHTATEEVELNGYVIPKDTTINFMVGEMGLDPNVWEDPMEFRPERFLVEGQDKGVDFDITGSKEIKMMPFRAGRRICPAFHLEYFVANLIWHFQWNPVEGDDVDLLEKQEFATVMKNPLRARIYSRVNSV
uniref:Cytochrome P450 n=1 Tax=Solanum tuberosum TaxID=4113 RepID=M0ZIH5_SOLTU